MSEQQDDSGSETLTKARIAEHVYERLGGTKKDSKQHVEDVLELIKQTLEVGEELKVSGFGKFVVRHKDERMGRNPKTGTEITIPERKVVRFKISPVFKEELNGEREFSGF